MVEVAKAIGQPQATRAVARAALPIRWRWRYLAIVLCEKTVKLVGIGGAWSENKSCWRQNEKQWHLRSPLGDGKSAETLGT